MDISRRQWCLAILTALILHLLTAGFLWLGKSAPTPPESTPRGVMVSLDRFDAAPPPRAAAPSAPIESATPEAPVPSAPSPATAAAPQAGPAESTAQPETASDIGPQPASAARVDGTPAAGKQTAGTGESASARPAAVQSDAVMIRPEDASEPIEPQEQVVARSASPAKADTADRQSGNGAYGSSPETTDDYIVRLRAWLSRHKQYPRDARLDQVEGTVRLYLVIDQSGNVLENRIQQSSGSKRLDQAARQMVEHAEPLPGMPSSMQRNRLELIVPVVFSLH